ncbi:MAG: FAD-dependent monooxygenase [Anaerolineae bacterium]
MKILIIGGGPAGLYSGLLLKKVNPNHDVTVIERNPPGATYGWGVVFSDRTLASFREADDKSYVDITDNFVIWDAIDVHYGGELIRCGGHIFAGLRRTRLLNILQRHCEESGVKLRLETEVTDLSEFEDFDLLIGADGINSVVRETYADTFKPSLEVGKAKYIWLGTHKPFDSFTFIFRESEHGLFQAHVYPFDGYTSTVIVECDESTWQRAGLDQADEAESITYCEQLFAEQLCGHALMSNQSRWINFVTVRNRTWRHENIVLLGDSAHTAHFSIGSGTKLAMEDAIALAKAFERHDDVETALSDYELERRPRVEALQSAAHESRTYFENVRRYLHLEPVQFTFHLLTRSGRLSYSNLRLRDPYYVDNVDRWFAATTSSPPVRGGLRGGGTVIAPPPMLTPLNLRGMTLPNRVVLAAAPTYSAEDGVPNDGHRDQLNQHALGGAALVMSEPTAVSPEGRITPGCTGMYRSEHAEAWAQTVDFIHANSPAKVALQLNHAGRRGSTRPRLRGLDRPLREGNWPLIAPSPLPYTPQSQMPKEMNRTDMDQVRDDFVRAAEMAEEAGFDMLQLHFGHGYLLASFISPLTNQRGEEYGGPLENRMRFPLEVFDAVRATWPEEKPLSVAITATDWVKGGFDLDDAVAVAQMLTAHGCDLIQVLAGQTTASARPTYGAGFLTLYSDWVRNEAGVATMVGGYLTKTDEINTAVAAGRADLCVMDLLDG